MGVIPAADRPDPITRIAARTLAFPGEPLEATGAELEAGNGNGKAASALRTWQHARAAKNRIAAVCSNTRIDDCQWEDGRIRATRYRVGEVGPVVHVDGRAIREDWRPDPVKLAKQLNSCGTTRGVHRIGGKISSHVLGCTSSLCPDCCRRKAGKRVGKMAPVIAGLAERGYQVAHLTITQPVGKNYGRPVVLVNHYESQMFRRRLQADGIPISAEGYAVPGESLADAIDRFRQAMTTLRDGRASRDWWSSTVVGNVCGIEWTGHNKKSRALRWHVHAHLLVVFAPGVDLATWIRQFGARWTDLCPGASVKAQRLDAIKDDQILEAVKEVMKYPFKPSTLTHAQVLEVLASAKGRKFHFAGGFLHGNSKVSRAVKASLRGDPMPELTSEQAQLVEDLLSLKRAQEAAPPVEVAYTPAEESESDTRPKSRRAIEIDGRFYVPLSAAGLASAWLEGRHSLTVVWNETGGGGAIEEELEVGDALLSCATWRGGDLDPGEPLPD